MEKLRNKNILRRTAAAGVGVLALLASGCGEYKNAHWDLNVACAEDATSPTVSNIQDGNRRSLPSFEIDCDGKAPKSIEIVSGPDLESKNSEELGHNVEIDIRGYEDFMESFSPGLHMTSESQISTEVQITDNADFQRVVVVPAE